MKYLIKILPYIAIAILIAFLLKGCEKSSEINRLNIALEDSLRISVNDKRQQEAKIQILEASNEDYFLRIESDDSTIIWLQSTIKEYKGKISAAVVLSNSTTSSGSSAVKIIHDTITGKPIYSTGWENKWETGSIIATADSIYRDIKINNKFEITFGKESNGWFKKKESEATITNLNPNTSTQEFRSFTIKQKPKKLSLGFQAGYGITNKGLSPYLGIGISYSLISVK